MAHTLRILHYLDINTLIIGTEMLPTQHDKRTGMRQQDWEYLRRLVTLLVCSLAHGQ